MKINKKILTGYAISTMVLTPLCHLLLSVSAIPISEIFRLGPGRIGLLFWGFNGGLLAAYLLAGSLCDQIGERLAFFCGTIICACGLLACQFTGSFLVFEIIVFALGIGSGVLWIASVVLINNLHRERHRLAIGGSQMVVAAICVIGPPFFAWLIRWQDWHIPYIVLFLYLIVISVVLCSFRFPETEIKKKKILKFIDIHLLKQRRYLILNLCSFFHSGAEVSISSYVCIYLAKRFEISLIYASIGLMLYSIGMVFGRGILSKLPERYSDVHILKICVTGSGVFLLLLFFKINYVISLVLLTLIGLFIGGNWPAILIYAGKHFKKRTGMVTGHLSLSGSIGSFIFIPLSGLIAEHTNISMILVVPFVLITAMLLSLFWLGRQTSSRTIGSYT